MPVDNIKTILQVEGASGLSLLQKKMSGDGGFFGLWDGAYGSAVTLFVSHYPWFLVYNWLSLRTQPPSDGKQKSDTSDKPEPRLLQTAMVGFTASVVSDVIANSFRVIKTKKQTSPTSMSYQKVASDIIARDGIQGKPSLLHMNSNPNRNRQHLTPRL